MADGTNSDAVLETAGFSVLQNSPDYFVVLEPDWSVIYANPSFQERFCPAGMVPGAKFLDFLDTPSNRRVREMAEQFFSESRRIDLNHITPESSTATVHYCFFPLRAEGSGRPLVAGGGRGPGGGVGAPLGGIPLNFGLGPREKGN